MLTHPLILPSKLSSYLRSNYDFVGEPNVFIKNFRTLSRIELDHKSRYAHVLYQDTKRNPGEVSAWDIALSLHENSYITGYTLLSLLNWTEYLPKHIYINWIRKQTQIAKSENSNDELIIDNDEFERIAFTPKKTVPPLLEYDATPITILSGQYIDSNSIPQSIRSCPKTFGLPSYAKMLTPERLFIEALINYHYFGGADIVWSALLSQARKINNSKLIQLYHSLHLKYPYANAIGYIFEKANVDDSRITSWLNLVNRRIGFHLFLGDQERRQLNTQWSLWIPKRFL